LILNSSENLYKIFKTVSKIVIDAGKNLKAYKFKHFKSFFKNEKDIVTEVDLLTEEYLIKHIKREFKESSFLTEETNNKLPHQQEFLWIIDPLDGTINYYRRFMFYSISVALYMQKIVMGIIYAPEFDALYWTFEKNKAYKNKEEINVSSCKEIKKAFLVTGFSNAIINKKTKPFDIFKRVSLATLSARRCGSAALDLAMVAEGIFDGFWEEGLNPWDIAAGSILVENAGGMVSDFSNKKISLYAPSIVATNRLIHTPLIKLITAEIKK
jgi:myo-inositol-1(or 4)-monophosphatase